MTPEDAFTLLKDEIHSQQGYCALLIIELAYRREVAHRKNWEAAIDRAYSGPKFEIKD